MERFAHIGSKSFSVDEAWRIKSIRYAYSPKKKKKFDSFCFFFMLFYERKTVKNGSVCTVKSYSLDKTGLLN